MMTDKERTKTSKFLSLVLRHEPQTIGIALDDAGWVDVDGLLAAIRSHRHELLRVQLDEIVATSDKQRFAFSDDGRRIRANQGHSVEVDLGYQPAEPPEILYHGTVEKFLPSIRESGLIKGERHHVHLADDVATAEKVGQRRGRPVVLVVDAGAMHAAGISFFVTPNGVWLTDYVAPQFLKFP